MRDTNSNTARNVSHKNFNHGTTTSLSVLSLAPSSVMEESIILSGVSSSSKSEILAAAARATLSAVCLASAVLFSAKSIKCKMTVSKE